MARTDRDAEIIALAAELVRDFGLSHEQATRVARASLAALRNYADAYDQAVETAKAKQFVVRPRTI